MNSLRRTYNFFILNVKFNFSTLSLVVAIITLIPISLYFLIYVFNNDLNLESLSDAFNLILNLIFLIFSSIYLSKDLQSIHSPLKAALDFTLPLNTIERYIVILFKYFVFFPILIIFFYHLGLFVLSLFSYFFLGRETLVLNVFSISQFGIAVEWRVILEKVLTYSLNFSLYFAGALSFKSSSFIKTTLIFIIVGILYLLFISSYVLSYSFANLLIVNFQKEFISSNLIFNSKYLKAFITLLFLVFSFLKLEELEVRD